MDWLRDFFDRYSQTPEKKKKRAEKRQRKKHSKRVRRRERELSRQPGIPFFWGSVAFDTTEWAVRKEKARDA